MRSLTIVTVLCWLSLGATDQADCQDSSRIIQENGVTYREVRERVRRPVAETEYEERQQTVYRQQTTSKVYESHYTVHVPVTEYRWQAFRTDLLNPFVPPSTAYRLVPQTRWEPRVGTVRVPMTHTEWVPQTQTVKVPVRTLRFVEEERVRRAAVSPPNSHLGSAAGGGAVATRPQYGGIRRLDDDPPRYGATIRR
jgi:hypothetical protein